MNVDFPKAQHQNAEPQGTPPCCQHPDDPTLHRPVDTGHDDSWVRHVVPPQVAAMLHRARRRAGMTWPRASKATGVSTWFLRQLEAGERAPSFDVLDKLADGLKLTAQERALLSEYTVARGRYGPYPGGEQ